jgi:uncharacterized protein with FMN-binding domain
MKRGLLIAGGTLGGLGAVMSITPPQLSSTSSLSMGDMAAVSGAAAAPSQAPAASTSASAAPAQSATATKPAATKKATNKPASKATTNSNTNSNTNSVAATTDPTPAAVAAPAGINGTFTGPSIFVQYGNVQVQITVVNGRITDAKAVVAPSGKNDRYTNMAVPVLKKQTLAAQSANIQGVSGASYTSYGWYTSLQGALAKAGM